MADNPTLPYIPNTTEVQQAIEYSNVEVIQPTDGIIINQGTIMMEIPFNSYDTHVEMCYEYSDCQLLEPQNGEDLYGILICETLEENNG